MGSKKIFFYSTLIFISRISFFGCTGPDQSVVKTGKKADSLETANKITDPQPIVRNNDSAILRTWENSSSIDTIYAGTADTTIMLKGKEALLLGHLVANKSRPEYKLTARKGQVVTATIKSVKKGGNVRINQIRQPGGALDGPFGDSLSYTLKRNGRLGLIIGENLMAGDPYTGDFILHIKISGQ